MTTVIILVAVGLVLGVLAGFVAVRSAHSRRGGVELEPPAPPAAERDSTGTTVAPPRPAPEPADELVAEIEEALAPVAEPEVAEPEVEAPPSGHPSGTGWPRPAARSLGDPGPGQDRRGDLGRPRGGAHPRRRRRRAASELLDAVAPG